MLRNSPLGLRLTKECLEHSIDAGSLEAGDRDGGPQPGPVRASRDFREGVAAFLEKRAPHYTDR